MTPDVRGDIGPQIAAQVHKDGNQEHPASLAQTSDVVTGGTDHGDNSTGECSWSPRSGPMFISLLSLSVEGTSNHWRGNTKPAEPSGGMCRHHYDACYFSPYASHRETS